MLGKRAADHRSGDDAGEIEGANARERPRAGGEGHWWCLADLDDFDQRQRGDGVGLRVRFPFRSVTDHIGAATCGQYGVFKVLGAPLADCAGDGGVVAVTGEGSPHRLFVMRKVTVKAYPATVAALVKSGRAAPEIFDQRAVTAHEFVAADGCPGVR